MKFRDSKDKKAHRFLYISEFVPPFMSGPSVLVHRLLRHFPNDSYVFLSPPFEGNLEDRIDEGLRLSGGYDYVLNAGLWKFLSSIRARSSMWKWLQVPVILARGMQAVHETSIKHILAVPFQDSEAFFVSACWLHRITRIPLSIYFFDIFYRGRRDKLEDRTRAGIERIGIKMASNVFVMSEPLQEHYRQKYGIKPILLPHPVDLSFHETTCNVGEDNFKQSGEVVKIVFTGMIYESQLDAILNLVNVVNGLPNVELHIYAPLTETKRQWMGITGHHVIFHGPVSYREIPTIQQKADILLLPMAFDYVYPHMIKEIPADKLREQRAAGKEVIKTASPSKLPEYLAAGRPILIHAPFYSYVAWYGKTHQCAEVVDTPDLERLRESVLRLRSDRNYRNFLVANARKAAEEHQAERVSFKLQRCLGIL